MTLIRKAEESMKEMFTRKVKVVERPGQKLVDMLVKKNLGPGTLL